MRRLLEKPTASLVACRGRRRIGKSTLFREFARREKLGFISIEGLGPRKGQTDADQLRNFGERLAEQVRGKVTIPKSWSEAFHLLSRRIPKRGRQLVLLDEISWMGRHEPDFAGYLKNGWDDDLKHHDNLILVLCGSVSSWVRKNLLDSATFGGRFSRDIVLRELPLGLCAAFWGDRRADLTSREFLDVLSVTGGVPRYLEEVNPALSELPGWQTIMHFQFENLVLNRVMDFKERLHLGGATILSAAPYRKTGADGVQIDLMIQTEEALYVVEVKRRKRILPTIVDEVKAKVGKLRHPRRISVRKGLIYDGELSPSVKRGGYFDSIIDLSSLIA